MSLTDVPALLGLLGGAIYGTFPIAWKIANKKKQPPTQPKSSGYFLANTSGWPSVDGAFLYFQYTRFRKKSRRPFREMAVPFRRDKKPAHTKTARRGGRTAYFRTRRRFADRS